MMKFFKMKPENNSVIQYYYYSLDVHSLTPSTIPYICIYNASSFVIPLLFLSDQGDGKYVENCYAGPCFFGFRLFRSVGVRPSAAGEDHPHPAHEVRFAPATGVNSTNLLAPSTLRDHLREHLLYPCGFS